MKNRNLAVCMFYLTLNIINGQNITNVRDSIFNMATVDKKPEYPGGIQAFAQFVSGNIELPKLPEYKGGKIITSFVINYDGSVDNIKILRDAGFGTGEEIKRLLGIAEKWIPGEQNGEKVKVNYVLPITLPKIEPEVDTEMTDTVDVFLHKEVEVKPDFPGGIEAFYKFVGKNFITPKVERLQGKIFVSFIIDIDGSIKNITVIRDIGYGTKQETIRVLKLCPKWNPGINNGIPVKVKYSFPINVQSSI